MSEHTKEPWSIEYMGCDESDVLGADGTSVIWGSAGYMPDINACRVVACVNACAGISTERLEQFNDWSKAGVVSAATYRHQRDELLAALKDALHLIETISPIEGDTVRKARKAIANAEDGE